MPHYRGKYSVQIGSKSPSKPGRGVVGLNIDRCIIPSLGPLFAHMGVGGAKH